MLWGRIYTYGNDSSHVTHVTILWVCVSMCVVAYMRIGCPYELWKSECPWVRWQFKADIYFKVNVSKTLVIFSHTIFKGTTLCEILNYRQTNSLLLRLTAVCYAFISKHFGNFPNIFLSFGLLLYLIGIVKHSVENHMLAIYVGHQTERLYNSYEGHSCSDSSKC